MLASAPTFEDIHEKVYEMLNGKIWVGHNILNFDKLRIQESFERIGKVPPVPVGFIDTLPLLRNVFNVESSEQGKRRMKNQKLATYGRLFHLGEEKHRALDDVRMNIEVLKRCATIVSNIHVYLFFYPKTNSYLAQIVLEQYYSAKFKRFSALCNNTFPFPAPDNIYASESVVQNTVDQTSEDNEHLSMNGVQSVPSDVFEGKDGEDDENMLVGRFRQLNVDEPSQGQKETNGIVEHTQSQAMVSAINDAMERHETVELKYLPLIMRHKLSPQKSKAKYDESEPVLLCFVLFKN